MNDPVSLYYISHFQATVVITHSLLIIQFTMKI